MLSNDLKGRLFKLSAVGAVAALLALGTVACGDGEETTTSTASTPTSADAKSQAEAKKDSSQKQGGDAVKVAKEEPAEEEAELAKLAVPSEKAKAAAQNDSGGGSKQFRVPEGYDNSVQDFGEEAEDTEREEAAVALHAFFEAQAAYDLETECAFLAKSMRESFRQMAASGGAETESDSCPAILKAMTLKLSPEAAKELTQIDVGSLRTEGDRAFLLYKGADGSVYAMVMENEDGAWKVGSIAGTPLG